MRTTLQNAGIKRSFARVKNHETSLTLLKNIYIIVNLASASGLVLYHTRAVISNQPSYLLSCFVTTVQIEMSCFLIQFQAHICLLFILSRNFVIWVAFFHQMIEVWPFFKKVDWKSAKLMAKKICEIKVRETQSGSNF